MLSRRRKSFTLLELMIAFVIMAILSAVAIPSLINIASNDRTTADQTSAISLADASYYGAVSADSTGSGSVPVNYCDEADQSTPITFTTTGLFSVSTSATPEVTPGCYVSSGYSGTVYYQFGDPVIIAVTVPGTDGGPLPTAVPSDSSTTTSTSSTTTTTTVPPQLTISGGNGGFALDGSDIFLESGYGEIDQYNNTTGALENSLTLPSSPNGGGGVGGLGNGSLAVDSSNLWAVSYNDSILYQIDPSSDTIVNSIPVCVPPAESGAPLAVSSDGTDAWVTCGLSSGPYTVDEVDIATSTVVNIITVGYEPGSISADGTNVWVANEGDPSVTQINASTGDVVRTIPVGHDPSSVYSDGTDVFVANSYDGTISEIDASTGAIIHTLSPSGGAANSVFSVASDGTDIYVTAGTDANTVTELDIATGDVVNTFSTGNDPNEVEVSGGNIWVDNVYDYTVTELAP
jgi:YVTN family beta-propeller protein